MKTILDAYYEINHHLFDLGGCDHEIGDRKIYFGKYVEFDRWLPGDSGNLLKFTYYKPQKMKMLEKTYLRPGFIKNFQDKYNHRKDNGFLNIGMNFGSGQKDILEAKTGDCLMGISIVENKTVCQVGISFRASETCLRLIADIAFMEKILSQIIDMSKVTKWKFYFHTCYVSLFTYPLWTLMYPTALDKKYYKVFQDFKDTNFNRVNNNIPTKWKARERCANLYRKLKESKTPALFGPKGKVLL